MERFGTATSYTLISDFSIFPWYGWNTIYEIRAKSP
jgi:hypothetical protein